jgi:Fic family protein
MSKKSASKPDIEAGSVGAPRSRKRKGAKAPLYDGGESVDGMEPMLISASSSHRAALSDKVMALTQRAAEFRSRLPEGLIEPLAELVREMNCYYSNLIEGHNTHPIEIQRALFGQESTDPKTRDLQQEAVAHIAVQRWIDEGGLSQSPATEGAVREIHRRFYEALPGSLKWVQNPETGETEPVIPGETRQKYAEVGRHFAVSPGSVARHVAHWERAYGRLGHFETVLNAGAAHHRLLWIHPFSDGNGRVARLVSYAMLRGSLETMGLWSVSRGLARNAKDYKANLMACDLSRRNDLDGRGALSEEALAEFSRFFLNVCLDQIEFMEALMRPRELRARMMSWADDEIRLKRMHEKTKLVLDHILFNGQLERKDLPRIVGMDDRQARRVAQPLVEAGLIRAATSRAAYRLAFPATLAARLMPGLYPISG